MNRLITRRPEPTSADTDGALHPVLARVYRARNASCLDEADRSLERLLPPTGLKGIDAAVALLVETLATDGRILIVADFDADGATSCALTVRALRALGATDVRYLVPNRFEYGYGLTPEIVALAKGHAPALLITVDNGISSVDGVVAAKDAGMRVLITDHHLPGPALPPADAIVNPNQPDCGFASKNLAGCGVAFYLMLALRAALRANGWFSATRPEPNLARLLDLVALGTVADLVPLDYNNRILVAQGLARMRAGQCCAGVRALLGVAGRALPRLTAGDLGFCVAPRLNAAGRLTDMTRGIECLLADDDIAAAALAAELDALNRDRRAIEADMQVQALAAIADLKLDAGLPYGVCLYDPSWHQGVIGLVAARVKDRVHRPVIAFAPGNGSEIKGSARSIAGLHIRDTLDAVAARHPGLLRKFGGHAMAAGVTLEREHFDAFRQAFDAEVRAKITDADLQNRVLSDGELADDDLSLTLAELLRDAGPWGQGFPEPIFDGEFDVVERRVVGERHLKLALRRSGRRAFDAIAFNAVEDGAAPAWPRVRAAFRLDVNEYRGTRALQLVLEHVEPVESMPVKSAVGSV